MKKTDKPRAHDKTAAPPAHNKTAAPPAQLLSGKAGAKNPEKIVINRLFPNQPQPAGPRRAGRTRPDTKRPETAFNPATLRRIELELQALAQFMYFDPAQQEIFDDQLRRMTAGLQQSEGVSLSSRFQRETERIARRSRAARGIEDMPEATRQKLRKPELSPFAFFKRLMSASAVTE